MPKTVTVPVLRAFTYEGRSMVEGELVTMAPLEAAAHARQKHVSLSKGAYLTRALSVKKPQPLKIDPPTPEPEPAPKRRRYRRRDLQAEE